MTTELTIFKARLVQDSALSISGIDGESTADQAFTRVDGLPVISGRGLKGAAVAMARRCFASLPRSVSEERNLDAALVRSAWLFEHARQVDAPEGIPKLPLRAGVGILQQTGARAEGVLYDLEVVPAGTAWALELHVDWRLAHKAKEDPAEVEGILGYVLQEQWSQGRCWLGGGVARGLGWCHLEQLQVWRLDGAAYDRWSQSGRTTLPAAERECPTARPTRSWYFRTHDVTLDFGEYRPAPEQAPWGLDMLAIGAHSQDSNVQRYRAEHWVASRERADQPASDGVQEISTARSIVMENCIPLLPGSSLRGPLRHAYSRWQRAQGGSITDPHLVTGEKEAPPIDAAMELFGTLSKSSQLLIRDGLADDSWCAVRLQQHAEDEFTAGSYDTNKRDTVRLLRASFSVRLLLEGPDEAGVQSLQRELDEVIELGELGHLPIGGHKTRGAGWGRWTTSEWRPCDVAKEADAPVRPQPPKRDNQTDSSTLERSDSVLSKLKAETTTVKTVPIRVSTTSLDVKSLSLGDAAHLAKTAMNEPLECWWCEPRLDLSVSSAPQTFGQSWPDGASLQVDEVVFFTARASWRAARTATGWRAVLLQVGVEGGRSATCREIPAFRHGNQGRFDGYGQTRGSITLREWSEHAQVIGYTARGVTDERG